MPPLPWVPRKPRPPPRLPPLILLALVSCSHLPANQPRSQSVSEESFVKNLPLAEAGDQKAISIMVEYYTFAGPDSHLEYWKSKAEDFRRLQD